MDEAYRSASALVCGVRDARMDHDAEPGRRGHVFRRLSGTIRDDQRVVRATDPLSLETAF